MTRNMLGAVVLALALSSCASAQTVDLATLSKSAYTARTAYAVALTAANQYAAMPRCEVPNPPPCSSQAVVNIMRASDVAADNATLAAEKAVRDMKADPTVVQAIVTAATASVQALTATVNSYRGK